MPGFAYIKFVLISTVFFALTFGVATAQSSPVRYTVTFEPLWSAQTHPQDFPPDAHFSALVGAVHIPGIQFWSEGTLASTGVQDVAEAGSPLLFSGEIQLAIAAGQANEVLVGTGFFLPGSDSLTFDVPQPFTRLTLINMIAPSPDWFTGISSVDLFEGGDWISERIIEVFPYDAGTDSGVTYASPNLQTVPPQPISQILGFPFENGASVAPVGRFVIRRADTPLCDFELTQSTYLEGDVFGAQSWRLANFDNQARAIEVKVWLEIAGAVAPTPIFSLGADGSFVLPAGFDFDLGPLPLLTIDATFPKGTYAFNCRLVDPVTGEELVFDENQALVQ